MADKKKVYTIVPHEDMVNICNAIRKKTGFSGKILAKEMGPLIRSIEQEESGIDFDGWFVRYYDINDKIWEVHGVKNNNHDTPPLQNPPAEIGKTIVGWRLEDGTECNFPFKVQRDVDLSPISDRDYLCFQAEEPNVSINLYTTHDQVGSKSSVYYSSDKETWIKMTPKINEGKPKAFTTIVLDNIGDKVYMRGSMWGKVPSIVEYIKFQITGKTKVSGSLSTIYNNNYVSCQSLFSGADITSVPHLDVDFSRSSFSDGGFINAFKNCRFIQSCFEELPVKTIGYGLCYGMFEGCTSLTHCPNLLQNVTEISTFSTISPTGNQGACERMFYGCSSLIEPPRMDKIQKIGQRGCTRMFENCTSLVCSPDMSELSIIFGRYVYNNYEYGGCSHMFANCSSLSNTINAPKLSAIGECGCFDMYWKCASLTKIFEMPSLQSVDRYGCEAMFSACTSLTEVPELPATYLNIYCYYGMFSGCTSLIEPPELPATQLADNCYDSMFSGCSSLIEAPELPATELVYGCYLRMFERCTSLIKPPELPATQLYSYCYYRMFERCTSLIKPPELPATQLHSSCYYSMFNGCSSLKISANLSQEYHTQYRIPSQGTGKLASSYDLTDMFANTGGTFTGTPRVNTVYYLSI